MVARELSNVNTPTYEELVRVLIEHLKQIAQEENSVNVEDTAFDAELTMMNILCRLDILDFVTHDEAFWNYDHEKWGNFTKSLKK